MLNVITLVGRLTRDPELRQTQSGNAIGSFTIACDDGRKGPNGEKQTLFIDCSLFGQQTDTLIKFFKKGSVIAVYGRLVSRKYVNKEGVTVTSYSVNCDRIEFNDFAKKEEGQQDAIPQQSSNASPVIEKSNNVQDFELGPDDLPF